MASLISASSISRNHTKTIIYVSSISGAVFDFIVCFLSLISLSLAPLLVIHLFVFFFVWDLTLCLDVGLSKQVFNQ